MFGPKMSVVPGLDEGLWSRHVHSRSHSLIFSCFRSLLLLWATLSAAPVRDLQCQFMLSLPLSSSPAGPSQRTAKPAEGRPPHLPPGRHREPSGICLGFVSSPLPPPKTHTPHTYTPRGWRVGSRGDFHCKPFLSIIKNLHLSL